MSQSFDVVVIGGGVVGLSAAIAMSQRGASVALLDAGSLTAEVTAMVDSRVYAINRASMLLLQALGVWEHLDSARLSPYEHMHVWDATTQASIDFDARMVAADRLGTMIEESVIKQALLQKASTQAIDFFPKTRVTTVMTDESGVQIGDGQNFWHANLLVVADGAASMTRDLLGVSLTTWPYHQDALVATVQTALPHQRTAYQVFNPKGPLAFLPLADPYQCSIVWSTTPQHAQCLLAMSDPDFSHALTEAFAAKLGECVVVSPRHRFSLRMRHVNTYVGSSWLLMGDAAHTIHPLAGLGLNLGLADLASWLLRCDEAGSYKPSKKMLGAYQRQRKHAVWQMIGLMSGLKTLFSQPYPPITILRSVGLRLCDSSLILKRFFIENAS